MNVHAKLPRLPKVKIKKAHVRAVHTALLRTALVLFACDFLACVWPWFGHWWEHREHFGVALGALLAWFGDWAGEKIGEIREEG